jgi:hypothetical protein
MKEWHIRHKIFHQVFKDVDLGDDLSNETIIEEFNDSDIIKRALEYPVYQTKELYYPGKSYSVAIIFAKLLESNFDEDFYCALDDQLLLFENDPYFKRYSEAKDVYDKIIEDYPWQLFHGGESTSLNFKKTCEYFYKEFLLHEETKHFAPSKPR